MVGRTAGSGPANWRPRRVRCEKLALSLLGGVSGGLEEGLEDFGGDVGLLHELLNVQVGNFWLVSPEGCV